MIVPLGRNVSGPAGSTESPRRMTQIDQGIAFSQPDEHRADTEPPAPNALLEDLVTLTKPGIVKMVTFTSVVGFGLGAATRQWELVTFIMAMVIGGIGTALSAAGANALNQAVEHRRDALMHRTNTRPIPAKRVSLKIGMWAGIVLSVLGVGVLWVGANWVAAAVSLATIVSYIVIYTPLKPVTPLATIIGAVPGALPPLIGWTVASDAPMHGLFELGGWSLFLLVFVWQVPHFLAIAWKYREDYARGGHAVLPVFDTSGVKTARHALIWTFTLVPVTLLPMQWAPGLLGVLYGSLALLAGGFMVFHAVRFAMRRDDASARGLFIASVIHLPIVLVGMVADILLHVLI